MLSIDSTPAGLLQMTHVYGVTSVRHAAALTGASKASVSQKLNRLKDDGYISWLGYPKVAPTHVHFASYYGPTRKSARTKFRGIEQRQYVRDDVSFSVDTKTGKRVPEHPMWILHTAEWLTLWLNAQEMPHNLYHEFVLRHSFGWYGSGRPPRTANTVLCSVPDLLLASSHLRQQLHIEVEHTPKSVPRYEKILSRVEPPNKPVVYVATSNDTLAILKKRLPQKPNVHSLVLYDDAGLEKIIATSS